MKSNLRFRVVYLVLVAAFLIYFPTSTFGCWVQDETDKRPADSPDGPPFVTAKAWAMADLASGKILFEEGSSKRLHFASTTKIMTAYLVLKLAAKDPTVMLERVTFSERADQTIGSTSGLKAGESALVKDLLYGLLLPSGNDASVAFAEHFGARLRNEALDETVSDYDAFILAMNQTASKLGMKDTSFANPHGLTDPKHLSTAKDLVRLAVEAMKMKSFRKYVSTRQHQCSIAIDSEEKPTTRLVTWKNTNQLLGIENYLGIKTGTTSAAGACLVSACRQGKKELVTVVLGSGSSRGRYADSRNLYRWAWQKLATESDKTPKQ